MGPECSTQSEAGRTLEAEESFMAGKRTRTFRNVAIVLAAGKGTRMKAAENKVYMKAAGKPVLYYSLAAFDKSPLIDEIIVVVGSGEELRCYDDVIDKYRIKKVSQVIPGGKERYDSVYEGLKAIGSGCGYVFIHDGARPCVDVEMISRAFAVANAYDACITGMPVKDTIRRVPKNSSKCSNVLDRSEIWQVQTPQVFAYDLVKDAYERYIDHHYTGATDDASIVEQMTRHAIHMAEGSYDNIKVTTHGDLTVVENILKKRASLRLRK